MKMIDATQTTLRMLYKMLQNKGTKSMPSIKLKNKTEQANREFRTHRE